MAISVLYHVSFKLVSTQVSLNSHSWISTSGIPLIKFMNEIFKVQKYFMVDHSGEELNCYKTNTLHICLILVFFKVQIRFAQNCLLIIHHYKRHLLYLGKFIIYKQYTPPSILSFKVYLKYFWRCFKFVYIE